MDVRLLVFLTLVLVTPVSTHVNFHTNGSVSICVSTNSGEIEWMGREGSDGYESLMAQREFSTSHRSWQKLSTLAVPPALLVAETFLSRDSPSISQTDILDLHYNHHLQFDGLSSGYVEVFQHGKPASILFCQNCRQFIVVALDSDGTSQIEMDGIVVWTSRDIVDASMIVKSHLHFRQLDYDVIPLGLINAGEELSLDLVGGHSGRTTFCVNFWISKNPRINLFLKVDQSTHHLESDGQHDRIISLPIETTAANFSLLIKDRAVENARGQFDAFFLKSLACPNDPVLLTGATNAVIGCRDPSGHTHTRANACSSTSCFTCTISICFCNSNLLRCTSTQSVTTPALVSTDPESSTTPSTPWSTTPTENPTTWLYVSAAEKPLPDSTTTTSVQPHTSTATTLEQSTSYTPEKPTTSTAAPTSTPAQTTTSIKTEKPTTTTATPTTTPAPTSTKTEKPTTTTEAPTTTLAQTATSTKTDEPTTTRTNTHSTTSIQKASTPSPFDLTTDKFESDAVSESAATTSSTRSTSLTSSTWSESNTGRASPTQKYLVTIEVFTVDADFETTTSAEIIIRTPPPDLVAPHASKSTMSDLIPSQSVLYALGYILLGVIITVAVYLLYRLYAALALAKIVLANLDESGGEDGGRRSRRRRRHGREASKRQKDTSEAMHSESESDISVSTTLRRQAELVSPTAHVPRYGDAALIINEQRTTPKAFSTPNPFKTPNNVVMQGILNKSSAP